MGRLICLGGGIEGLPILSRAKALGHQLVVVDGNPNAPGFALSDTGCVASCYDAARTVEELALLSKNDGASFDGVLCCAVDAPHVAAAVAEKFGLPGLTPEQAHLSVNKPAQKYRLQLHHIDVPRFHTWDRIVVKPPASRGARGVRLIDTGGVVEEWLDGPQLSTESIVQDGNILWTGIAHRNYIRLQEFAPYIIEDGYEEPYTARVSADPLSANSSAGGDAALLAQVNAVLKRACAALGWYQQGGGTVKGDLILHGGRVVVLELAARLSGGFLSTHGHPLAYGIDFVEAAIQLALGQPPAPSNTFPAVHLDKFVCQRYVFPEPGDIGRRVKDGWVVGFYPDDGVAFGSCALHVGDIVRPVTDHAARWGQATCTGATPEQAQMRAIAAVAAMKQAVVLD